MYIPLEMLDSLVYCAMKKRIRKSKKNRQHNGQK